MKYPSLFARLLANSEESERYSFEGTPCWCWTAAMDKRRQYGHINLYIGEGVVKTFKAHRVMAELVLGRKLATDAETIQHACDIPMCINPLHFEIASRRDNTADMQARRAKRARRQFKRLVDDRYAVDRFIRSLPVLKSTLNSEEIPF